jgi:hypothetical protein
MLRSSLKNFKLNRTLEAEKGMEGEVLLGLDNIWTVVRSKPI